MGTSAHPVSESKSRSGAGYVRIAGYRRVSFLIVLAPIISIIAVGLYFVARDAVSGFPDRRPIALFYTFGCIIFLPLSVLSLFWIIKVALIVRPPVLFIEDGCLVYGSKKAFCASIKDANVVLSPDDRLFRKLMLSSKDGKHLSVSLFFLDKSGPEIIDEVNANR
jgi:hypothetical protein